MQILAVLQIKKILTFIFGKLKIKYVRKYTGEINCDGFF
jgi:hypothetical protein